MTSVSAGHIILTPTQPVGSGRPQRESNAGPPKRKETETDKDRRRRRERDIEKRDRDRPRQTERKGYGKRDEFGGGGGGERKRDMSIKRVADRQTTYRVRETDILTKGIQENP